MINATHHPGLRSWVSSAQAPDTDFPIQNLPFGVAHVPAHTQARVIVAIGDQALDVLALAQHGVLQGQAQEAALACTDGQLNGLMALGCAHHSALRAQLSAVLTVGSPHQPVVHSCLRPQADLKMVVPARVGDFSDFFTSIHHATNSGRLARPDNPLLPNFKHLPVAYHSRSSSIVIDGTPCPRPQGQTKPAGATQPVFGPTRCLDFECEVGLFIGQGNALGTTIPLQQTQDHMFGLTLLNDWSARDMQSWESQPLGPFLAKSFMTSLSPWVVTMEALAPFRTAAAERGVDAPALLPYLHDAADRAYGGLQLHLAIALQTPRMREQGLAHHVISRPKFEDQYWTLGQMVAHQTSNGCNLQAGDLIGSGTVSGPRAGELGCLKEITQDGQQPIALPSGESKTYLEAGDEVVFTARCQREGFVSIGFGRCRGRVLA
jgi:fumarylacetoacetase